jgi:hypothetical protein
VNKILRNRARCAYCDVTLESIHVHDFRQHECVAAGRISKSYDHDLKKELPAYPYFAVDGGHSYVKRVFGRKEDYVELSEYEEQP